MLQLPRWTSESRRRTTLCWQALPLMAARWTLDFAFFGFACCADILRASLPPALPRFELFLRAATRFFAFAMIISSKTTAGTVTSTQVALL